MCSKRTMTGLTIGLLAGAGLVHAQPCQSDELEKLLAADGKAGDNFGMSVACDGNTAVVGAIEEFAEDSRGSAYVFERKAGVWTQVAVLRAADGENADQFGRPVSISGDTIMVGAFRDDNLAGAVYVFERPEDGWKDMTQSCKLVAPERHDGDQFGTVAVSGDFAVVGVHLNDDKGDGAGAAYVFERDNDCWRWVATLYASDADPHDAFGAFVAFRNDTILIAAIEQRHESAGSAYVFKKPDGGWHGEMTETAKLTSSDGAGSDQFGMSVALSGDASVILIGAATDDNDNGTNAGAAYVFHRLEDGWVSATEDYKIINDDGQAGEFFGYGVALGHKGRFAVITAYGRSNCGGQSGAAYVYRLEELCSTKELELTASDCAGGDWFGFSAAISHGNVLIGAPMDDNENGERAGGVYTYAFSPEFDKLVATNGEAGDNFGMSVAIEGNTAVVGAIEEFAEDSRGSAYVFERFCAVWMHVATLRASDGDNADQFGRPVSISGDTIMVGAFNDDKLAGAVYVFERPEDGWKDMTQSCKLVAPERHEGEQFGTVAVSGDFAVVGVHLNDDKGDTAGAAYVFERDNDCWRWVATLYASDADPNDAFGIFVAFRNDTILIAAIEQRHESAGSAYVFKKPDGGWHGEMNETAKLTSSDGAGGDQFGMGVALSGDASVILIGAATDDNEHGNNAGAAYVFKRPQDGWVSATENCKITNDDGQAGEHFGYGVALDEYGTLAVIAAYLHDSDCGDDSGAAYVYRIRDDGCAIKRADLTAFDCAARDWFGFSVAMSRGNVLLGAPFDDHMYGSDAGSAYAFRSSTCGDANCDGSVDLTDVGPFITALLNLDEYQAAYPNCVPADVDANNDGSIDLADVEAFIGCLLREYCP